MKKAIFTAILVYALLGNLFAQRVSLSDAELVARNFYFERINLNESTNYETIKIANFFLVGEDKTPIYYVFNMVPVGYVVVSGYKNAIPVPAYSLHSSYSDIHQPPQFTAWMKQYFDQIRYTMENKTKPLPEAISSWKRLLSDDPSNLLTLKDQKEVTPMLISTWDQGNYYNQMCPSDPSGPAGHCYTGCVATAMGQLCYYFRWPDTGTGSYTYEHPDYGTIFADFGNTEYKWNQMTNAVQGQNDAVAELLFHLGVSVDMDYGPDGSGMWNHKAAYSLRTFFKYSPESQYLYRDSTNLDWDSVIIAHLDQKIPMYYAGWSVPNINGHAFIVDGYQTEDYFHFNWGWGGSSDGYFYLNNLIPGGNNFNLAQELVIHCYPDTTNYAYPAFCSNADTLNSFKGTIEDGSGPLYHYFNNANCSWLISTQTEEDSVTSITLNFNRFETEVNHDILTIYDGETPGSAILGQFSGSNIPAALNTSGNKVLITFETDDATNATGWFISYSSVIPTWCSGLTQLTELNGSVTDGSGSFNYHNNSTCMWNIQPEGAVESTLYFTEFDTEESLDVVKIYDTEANQLLATYSGTYEPGDLPDPVTSPSGKLFITFSTSNTGTRNGWSAYYSSEVGINETDHNGEISIYPNPVSDFIWIEMNLKEVQNVELIIYSINGEITSRQIIRSGGGREVEKIDISGLVNGIYTVKVVSNESVYLEKVVKVNE